MNIEVHIIRVMQPRTGVSKAKGNPYTIYQYVGQTFEQYSRQILFTQFVNEPLPQDRNAWGTHTCPVPNEGDEVDISFDLETTEFQRKDNTTGYETRVKPYRLVSLDNADPAAVAPPQQTLNSQQPYMAAPPQGYAPQQSVYPVMPQYAQPQPQFAPPQNPQVPTPDSDVPF